MKLKGYLWRSISCSSVLEEEDASAYKHAAQLIGGEVIKRLLKFISHDSFKHVRFFELTDKALLPEVSIYSEDRVNVRGKSWLIVIENATRAFKEREAGSVNLSLFVNSLCTIESFNANETLSSTCQVNWILC